MPGKVDLIAAIEAAGPDDLDEIETQIEAARKRLDALVAMRKVVSYKLNGRPARKITRRAGGATDRYRQAMVKYLLHAGPTPVSKLMRDCNVPAGGSVVKTLDSPWFERDRNGLVVLTAEGRGVANGKES